MSTHETALDQSPLSHGESKALVVEGGAMRGIFAAGVLDAFLEHNYRPFLRAYGVSAGATNLIGYLAGDHGRSRKIITGHACQPDFIDWRRFARGGHLCDVCWLWQQSFTDVPLNLENYLSGTTELWVTTTSARTGEAHYFHLDESNMHDVLTASCAIPIAYRDYPLVNGEPMTDGGVADAIPVIKAYEDGARDITVVLSRPPGYRKKPPRFAFVPRRLFRAYPALAEASLSRAERYNTTLSFIENPPQDCIIRVIVPPAEFAVGRLTQNQELLEQGYQEGHRAGLIYLDEMT
ncbi:patatin-like phospholipase family protein [Marinobacter orientalis]|uniref:Patatin family protein n=1 Tax=Marinobacter orientalis TaxID=1928859 RepID=A0A7Y0RC61_9GAMM|nr:patatin family protein [Marinobacter orientalis]NMT63540.1 patatin family protein [Marinobacter orientalis]TGX48596.1 patatin family protein [Marinobacter orientalis]